MSALAIPEQVTFYYQHNGAKRGQHAGLRGVMSADGANELWTFPRLDANDKNVFQYKPEVGCTLVPHGDIGTDQRTRKVTAATLSADNVSWLLTCAVVS
jgi:hypothetical protein